MRAILITYDLNSPGQSYAAVHEAIKELGSWWHHLESTWIVRTSLTPSQVWERLSGVADANDSFLVVDITHDTYSGWLTDDAWRWLREAVAA